MKKEKEKLFRRMDALKTSVRTEWLY